jgi:hypothetical protein
VVSGYSPAFGLMSCAYRLVDREIHLNVEYAEIILSRNQLPLGGEVGYNKNLIVSG